MPTPRTRPSPAERRRLLHRGLPIALLALAAFGVGILVGSGSSEPERGLAARFATAWERGDYPAMYALVSKGARRTVTRMAFTAAYREAAQTATSLDLRSGRASGPVHGIVTVPVTLRTRIFGTVRAPVRLPIAGSGDAARVAWRRELAFPGLRPGERLARRMRLPPRAAILARDGKALAEGAERRSAIPDVAGPVVGVLGSPAPGILASRRAAGYPEGARVGVTGLERIFDATLAGRPGGDLLAGRRRIASAAVSAGRDVRTTIDPAIERAAVTALAGRLGGVAAVRPSDGQVLALAGFAFSALQPPGSTFKMITATAALEAGLVSPSTAFPVRTGAVLEGRTLENANGESCGGSFVESFAESCNSVFAPLGARLGGARLVAAAERFGFNERPEIPGAATSTLPPAEAIGGPLAVGSSAIGQGLVQTTALQMASVAGTIGAGGRRARPTLLLHDEPHLTRATRPAIARTVRALMLAVVTRGTGTAAAIPGVQVAGKTGTAELGSTTEPGNTAGTDAWFAAFAPAPRPRVAVGVLLVKAGAGGEAAAPAARAVLLVALRRR